MTDNIHKINGLRGLSPRPEVLASPLAHHGALDCAELERLGLDPEEVVDFSVNSNPYGPSPAVREALTSVPLHRYPDREALALRHALADRLDVPPDRILAGNGVAELLWLVALAFVRPGDRVLVVGPTFGEYSRVAALMGARVETWTARPEQDFAVELDEVAQSLRRVQPQVAFLCNPNNPTGATISLEAIAGWAQAHPRTLFAVDEAYLTFAAGLRSALADLRLGYAVGHREVINVLAQARPPWSVNAMAQAAGVAALADEEHLRWSMGELARAKEALVAGLRGLGLRPLPSAVQFFLIRVGDGAAFRRALLRWKVQVRDCASFGLPSYVRIATRRPEENALLLEAIREVV
jgi:histidinol-phosphate/aromatic aminotransferase/cobyric acid decarboxylase-like protein